MRTDKTEHTMKRGTKEISLNTYFQAERIKQKHSAVIKLTVLMPIISVLMSAVLQNRFFAVNSYNWWYTLMYPGTTALVCASIIGKDKRMNNRAIWALPGNMKRVWDGKVLYGMGVSAAGVVLLSVLTVIAAFLMETFTPITFTVKPSVGAQIAACVLIWLSFCWQIPVCMFLTQALGRIPMLLIHMAAYMIMVFEASLHSGYMWFPGALTSRMMCVVLGVLPNGLLAEPGSMTYTEELVNWHSIPIGILASVIWFGLFWFVTRKWYERQVEKA